MISRNAVGWSKFHKKSRMAKAGVVNSNLLSNEEINRLISENEVLPYSNAIQATYRVQYAFDLHQWIPSAPRFVYAQGNGKKDTTT